MFTFDLLQVADDLYETPDGVWSAGAFGDYWVVCPTEGPGKTFIATGVDDARALLYEHLTRYAYRVRPGEQCAVCGEARPYEPGGGYGWWWHTACRGTIDPTRVDLLTPEEAQR